MGDEANVTESDSEQFNYERMQGELDAAFVFASGAAYHYQCGSVEHAAACLSDAAAIYADVMAALPAANLSGAQIHELRAMLIRLNEVLQSLGGPRINEAA